MIYNIIFWKDASLKTKDNSIQFHTHSDCLFWYHLKLKYVHSFDCQIHYIFENYWKLNKEVNWTDENCESTWSALNSCFIDYSLLLNNLLEINWNWIIIEQSLDQSIDENIPFERVE